MNPIEYKINLDCRRAESQVIITAKQGEASGRKITFSLNEGRLPYKVPSGVTAVLRAKKPSGAVLYNTCTVTPDGNVEYIITTQTVAEVGKLPCELQLSQDGKVIFSPNFTLLVYKNLSVDSEVESSDEFTALQAAISRAENLTDGTTFTPTVSEDGVLSWTNDGGKANPDPVNIKGPQGEKGEGGAFRVNVTYSDGVYSADKTFDEIKAAYDAGKQPYVVYGGNTIYTFSFCYFASEQMFMDFERYNIVDDTLKNEALRIYSFVTGSGSNVVRLTEEFNAQSGVGIQSVTQTTTSAEDGGLNVITVTKTDGTSSTFTVKNGSKGSTGATGADGKSAYQYAQESGYTGTEEEFAEKLAQEQLYGTTLTLTPTQVYDAVSVGIPVEVQYFDGTYGSLSFTVFNAESSNVIVSQRIISANGEYILAELIGNKPNGTWNFVTTTLAEKTDIPSLEGYATEAYVQNYHDNTKQDIITDLATIRSGASKGATAVQPEAGKGLFSGSYNDLTDKPTIPAVTEESVTNALGYVPADVNDVFAYTENPTFTNLFDTVEIEYGKLINITDKTIEDTTAHLATTGFIPVNANSIIRVNDDFLIAKSGTPAFMLYDANKNAVQALRTSSIVASAYYAELVASDANGYITAFKINKPSSTAYIRIANDSRLIGENPVLTVDEEITYEMGYGEKLNSKVKVDFSQVTNAPQKNCWDILPYERLNIAYSFIGRKPINTVEHFTDAATNFGYNALKCDVRPTSDGELVCCHDAGFTFDSNGYITTYDSSNQTVIHDVTAATVLGYQFSTGEHPCLVGDYLDVCRKYGKVAFVTIRNEYMDVVIPKLLEELKAHNMTYATIINCMTYNSLVTWRTYDKSVMINYTLNAGVAIDQSEIDRAIGLGYCSLCGFGLTSSATTPNHDCDFEYARANGIRLLQAIAYKEGSPEACYAMGYDGCQIAYAWNPVAVSVDAYTKAETENLIATAIGGAIGGSY